MLLEFQKKMIIEEEWRNLHKYTRVEGGQDGVEVKSMIDLALVKKDMLPHAIIFSN